MLEDFLHFVWRTRRIDIRNLRSTQGHKIQIFNFGHYNTDAGPDFLEAKIEIDHTLWAGNVEMHLKSSDWYKHKHQHDPAYNNVILHVVLEHDKEVYLPTGEKIPCLKLKKLIDNDLVHRYKMLLAQSNFIPCQEELTLVPTVVKLSVLDRLLVERLELRTVHLKQRFDLYKNDWEEIAYQHLAACFGLKVNKEAFDMLSRSLPFRILLKHRDSLFQLESLLFGQAGMLSEEFEDTYPNQLKKEYQFLQKKYNLKAIPKSAWKYMRMRPANFPSIRIAQFAQFIYQTEHLFSKMLVAENEKEIHNLLRVKISGYWKTHFKFDKASKATEKRLGKGFKDLIIINGVAPLLFLYSKMKAAPEMLEKAIKLLESIKAEENKLIKEFRKIGFQTAHSGDSQSLLQLYGSYCSKKKCASCGIGNSLLKTKKR